MATVRLTIDVFFCSVQYISDLLEYYFTGARYIITLFHVFHMFTVI